MTLVVELAIGYHVELDPSTMQEPYEMTVGLKMTQSGAFPVSHGYVSRSCVQQGSEVRGVAYSRPVPVEIIGRQSHLLVIGGIVGISPSPAERVPPLWDVIGT